MDSETTYFLFVFVIIGISSYFSLRYMTLKFFIYKIQDQQGMAAFRSPSKMDKANNKQISRIKDETSCRNSEGVTANIMSTSDDTVSDVPSREIIQEDRNSEGLTTNIMSTSDDTVSDVHPREIIQEDRNSEGVTANIMSTSDDTVSDVPSREIIQEDRLEIEKRCSENTSDQHATDCDTDYDTEDEGEESDFDEEEDKVLQTFVNETNLKKYTDEMGVLPGLMKYIRTNLPIWKTRKLKIAIIGNSGTGKSSFINAIRGLKPEDKGAAPVGVTETTMKKQEYVLPSNENISLWDLPGVGTQNFKKDDYLNAVNLKEFDAFIIVSASRFSENDVWLANEILKQESYIFFLRTKIDVDLTNEKIDHPSTYHEASCLRKIKTDILSNLEKSKFRQKRSGIYLVSSRESSKFDFSKLLLKLNRILSKKRFALRRVLENHLTVILEKKRERKKGKFVLQKVLLYFGLGDLRSSTHKMFANCIRAFSLDDNTIESISGEIGMSVYHLKTEELKFFIFLENYSKASAHLLGPVTAYVFGLDIFIGLLNCACNLLAMDEARLIHLRLNHLEEQLRPLDV